MQYLLVSSTEEVPELSIVIPAYKEEATIGNTLESLARHFQENNYPAVEVVVSVGKSPDKTYEKALEKSHLFENFAIINNIMPHEKGYVVHTGMIKSRGEMCVYMDADLATPLHHLKEAVNLLRKNDVVYGQRNITNIHKGHRKFISLMGNFLVQTLLLPGFKDTQCGFKGFRRNAIDDLFNRQKINSWGFDMEILALAKSRNYSTAHLPIPDWQDMEGGTLNEGPKKTLKAAMNTFYDLLRIRYYLFRGVYNQR